MYFRKAIFWIGHQQCWLCIFAFFLGITMINLRLLPNSGCTYHFWWLGNWEASSVNIDAVHRRCWITHLCWLLMSNKAPPMLTLRFSSYFDGDDDDKSTMAGQFGVWMSLLAVRVTRNQCNQAECCSLSKLECCCCNIAFDDSCHVVGAWYVVEDMFDKLSNAAPEDIRNYCTR